MPNTRKYLALEEGGSTTVKSGFGTLHSIVVGTTSDQAIKIYDSVGSGGTKIGELKVSIAENTYTFDCRFATGLHVEKPGSGTITVIYS